MENDPLAPPEINTVKQIGSKYFRFGAIIALDDTSPEYLQVYLYGGTVRITSPEEREQFLQWYRHMMGVVARYRSSLFKDRTGVGSVLGDW